MLVLPSGVLSYAHCYLFRIGVRAFWWHSFAWGATTGVTACSCFVFFCCACLLIVSFFISLLFFVFCMFFLLLNLPSGLYKVNEGVFGSWCWRSGWLAARFALVIGLFFSCTYTLSTPEHVHTNAFKHTHNGSVAARFTGKYLFSLSVYACGAEKEKKQTKTYLKSKK